MFTQVPPFSAVFFA